MKKLLLTVALLASPIATISAFVAGPAQAAATLTVLGDLSSYSAIVTDVQSFAATGDFLAAEKRITDFETLWDNSAGAMRPLDTGYWGNIDDASDAALDALRASMPSAGVVNATVATLIAELDNPTLVAGTAGADTAMLVAPAAPSAVVITDANGRALPCEEVLGTLRTALETATLNAADQASVDALQARGTERCNADDDKRADDFFGQALTIIAM